MGEMLKTDKSFLSFAIGIARRLDPSLTRICHCMADLLWQAKRGCSGICGKEGITDPLDALSRIVICSLDLWRLRSGL